MTKILDAGRLIGIVIVLGMALIINLIILKFDRTINHK